MDRIEAVELKDQRFQRPKDFDLQKHLAKSFGVYHGDGEVRVRVRFLPTVARYVGESTWHPSQKLTRHRDGSVIAEFTLDGMQEIKRWIMGFGRNAIVLEPTDLCEQIAEEVNSMLVGIHPVGRPTALNQWPSETSRRQETKKPSPCLGDVRATN